MLRGLALAAEYMKYVVIIELEMLQFELKWALVMDGLFPWVLVWLQVRIEMAGRAVRWALAWFGRRVSALGKVSVWGRALLLGWGVSVGNQVAVTVGAQAVQFWKGTRSEWDGGYLRDGGVVGLLGGVLAPGMRWAGHELSGWVRSFLGEVLGRADGAVDWHRAFADAVGHVVRESLHEGTRARRR